MNEKTKANVEQRLSQIKRQLGELAYERRAHMIVVEKIDLQVTQMEAQGVMLEATKNDLAVDERDEIGRQEAEKVNATEERSTRAKAAAEKRKGAKAKTERTGRNTKPKG